ncbi:GNAT family N-acetyltransferase [Symbioplanes lichenis]|uniref:GNAT family N-acetyltransferase n=1 Tax=Symbioplanes lichenis TaxID=1629072 RepID=UPI002738A922|nr:GNAT family N-acetyltransferase [Actinoplanes lichenis]
MPITLRRAGADDAKPLHDLAARTFGLATPPGLPQSDIDAFIALNLSVEAFTGYLADPLRVLTVAEEDDSPVGYSMLVGGPVRDPELVAVLGRAAGEVPLIELSKFYVLAGSHGSGVAATLMAATLTAAGAAGAAYCWLGVNDRNERAARFYAKHGFELIGTKPFRVGETHFVDHVRGRTV